MRVVIGGGGAVGRSVAQELVESGHSVLIIERSAASLRPDRVPGAEWLLADACELATLEQARLDTCDVAIAATGDDKANLVMSLLAKTEFTVPRTVARVNNPSNEWLFGEAWGVDVAVSTPRIMAALVEEAVAVGDLVRLFTFRQSGTNLVELTVPADSPHVGRRLGDIDWPEGVTVVVILRQHETLPPERDRTVEAGDELLFVTPADAEEALAALLASRPA